MAAVILKPYNTLTLAGAEQIIAPSSAHYNITMLNSGTAAVYISNASTVSATDPASYTLPVNLSLTVVIWGPTGIWVSGAGALSVTIQPRGE